MVFSDNRQRLQNENEKKSAPITALVGKNKAKPDGTTRPLINGSETFSLSTEMQRGYQNKAIMSLDGLFRPVSMDGYGNLPRFIVYPNTDPSGCGTNSIYQDDLNPFTNPSGWSRDKVARLRNTDVDTGHDIDIIARTGTARNNTPSGGLIMQPGGASGVDYQDDYGAFALRGPLLLQSWGYDTNGYPVPNAADSEALTISGIFEDDIALLDECKFLPGHLKKAHTWAVAPVDLRLDRERGLWVAGGGASKVKVSDSCVIDNFQRAVDCDTAVSFDVQNICFGRGIVVEVPCDPDTLPTGCDFGGGDLPWCVDSITGDLVICQPSGTGNREQIKIGAAIDISISGAACPYSGWLAYEGTVENPDGDYYRGGKFNDIVLGAGFITERDPADPCRVIIGQEGIQQSVATLYKDITCLSVTGADGLSNFFYLVGKPVTMQFNCAGHLNTYSEGPEEVICDLSHCCSFQHVEDCCGFVDNSFQFVNLTANNGPGVFGPLEPGNTFALNGNSGGNLTLEVRNNDVSGHDITSISAFGNYFNPSHTIGPSTPALIGAGGTQVITISGLAVDLGVSNFKSGQITVEFSTGTKVNIGLQGVIM